MEEKFIKDINLDHYNITNSIPFLKFAECAGHVF